MKNKIVLLLFAVILFSCSKETSKYKEVKFDKEYQLTLDSIKMDPFLYHERKMVIDSNHLLTLNIDSDTIFRVFDLTTGKQTGRFGNLGNGPHDFNHANISGFRIYDNGCVVTDLTKISFIELPEKNITNSTIVFKKQYFIPEILNPFNGVFVMNDTLICGMNMVNATKGIENFDKELALFNTRTKDVGSFIEYSKLIPDVPANAQGLLYQKSINGSRKQQKMVMVYRSFPLLKICDFSGEILTEHIIAEGPPYAKGIEYRDGNIMNLMNFPKYYNSVQVTDNYIYALFEPVKIETKNGHEYVSVPVGKKQMHIFNWDGEPMAKIILEDWMNVYTPASDDSYIYLIDPMKEDYLFRYSLKTVI